MPLSDSDGDLKADTGLGLKDASTTVVVAVEVPAGATTGQSNAAVVQITLSLNSSKSKTVTLRAAIPALFAKAYQHSADSAGSLYLVQPVGQARRAVASGVHGYATAIAQTPDGFIYVWGQGAWVGGTWISELWYALLDWHGELKQGPVRLTNYAGVALQTNDGPPVVAVPPDGNMGVLWEHALYDGFRSNTNIYFALLDPSGNVALPPTDLTGNQGWSQWDTATYGVPNFWSSAIAATGDNRFVLPWNRQHQETPGGSCPEWCYVTDVYCTICAGDCTQVKGLTRFTQDGPGGCGGNYSPNLAILSGNRALATWYRDDDIYCAGLDSSGGVVHGVTGLTTEQSQPSDNEPKARHLSDGKVIIAWEEREWPGNQVRFALLDSPLNRTAGSMVLHNPAAVMVNTAISLAADDASRAFLTWTDSHACRHLYYAIVDSSGNVLTPPIIFRSTGNDSAIGSSCCGCGNTSCPWRPAPDPDGATWFAVSLVAASPGGAANLSLSYGNCGQANLTGAMRMLELKPGLSYITDTSGITPTVGPLAASTGLGIATAGIRISWHIPDVAFFNRGDLLVSVAIPASAGMATRCPARLGLNCNSEASPADDQVNAMMMAAPRFLPPVYNYW